LDTASLDGRSKAILVGIATCVIAIVLLVAHIASLPITHSYVSASLVALVKWLLALGVAVLFVSILLSIVGLFFRKQARDAKSSSIFFAGLLALPVGTLALMFVLIGGQ